jgi:hypothetical protein
MGEVLTNSQIGGRRNIIINGAMNVAQRGTSSTGLGANATTYLVDRFAASANATAGRFTMTQTADGPNGFANCLKLDCTTADTSIAAAEFLLLEQRIEGQNLQQLKKGTADAEKFTVSFYAKSNASRDIVLEIFEDENTRHVAKLFTIGTSWARYSYTFPGDTSGTLDDDNGIGFYVSFFLHAGSTYTSGTLPASWANNSNGNRAAGVDSFFSSTDNEFFLTGVQLEVGSQATPFEHASSFGEQLALCQRYYYERMGLGTALAVSGGEYQWAMNGIAYNTTLGLGGLSFPTPMRATPALGYSAVAHFVKQTAGRGDEVTAINLYDGAENATISTAYIQFNSSTSTAGGAIMTTQNASARLNFDAEL